MTKPIPNFNRVPPGLTSKESVHNFNIVAVTGAGGNHLRWLCLLDDKFAHNFHDDKDPENPVRYPFVTLEEKVKFISNEIYGEKRTWNEWLYQEWRFRTQADTSIRFTHDMNQVNVSDKSKTIGIVADPQLAYKLFVKFCPNLHDNPVEDFIELTKSKNQLIIDASFDSNVLTLSLDDLYQPTLDYNLYQSVINFFELSDNYEVAKEIHKRWYYKQLRAENEVIDRLKEAFSYKSKVYNKMRKLFYMGLESYESRYTLQLTEWNRRVFERRGLDVVYVPGQTIDNSQSISVGQVLDAHGRSYFGMSQIMNLVQMMRNGEVTGEDVVYFEDMFQPGIESLPYIMDQIPKTMRPRIFVRCLAQAIDPDDFVHVWGMSKWMGLYEQMVNELVKNSGGAILATNEEMVAHMKIAGWEAPIYNISGLAFGKEEVLERIGGRQNIKPFEQRTMRVGFAARWDQEKQPGFFMDLIDMWNFQGPFPVEFAIFQGGPLRSNNPEFVSRARVLEREGKLKIYENLNKNDYYNLLNDTRVLFNCALQDWVSNTVSEGDTLGCNVLYPAYRSFPETFADDPNRLYVPWSIDDAYIKLEQLLQQPHHNMGLISDWTNGTIDRCIDIIEGKGEQWLRMDRRYRDHVAKAKYHVVKIEE